MLYGNVTSYAAQCQLYLAASSIPNAGFGVFTTVPVKAGQPIQPYADAPSVPVFDPDLHVKHSKSKHPLRNWAHIEYFWQGDGHIAFEALHSEDNVVTIGSLANYHPFLYNVKPVEAEYDDSFGHSLDRNTHSPQIGAFSYYHGQKFVAIRDIHAGQEIFAEYGESWLDTRPNTFADFIPRKNDYRLASTILKQTLDMVTQVCQNSTCQDSMLALIQVVAQPLNARVASLLPPDERTLQRLLNLVQNSNSPSSFFLDTYLPSSYEHIFALNTVEARNVSWIEQHGMCLDHLVPQLSSIPLAGRGAFAQRYIPAGSRIVPVPLLQIPYRESLLMYPLKYDKDLNSNSAPNNAQLLLNYCFGHHNMSMLLCPATNANLINHCSSRKSYGGQCSDSGPNAKIAWASWDPLTNEWLNKTITEIDKLTEQSKRGLSFDIIAIRDIHPGDEVFIDYGLDWEEDWDIHVNTWKSWSPPMKKDGTFETYKSVHEMNRNKALEVKTKTQLIDSPYPDNVVTACIYKENEVDDKEETIEITPGRFTDETPLYQVEPDAYDIVLTDNGESFTIRKDGTHTFWPCEVIEIHDTAELLTVRILSPHWDDTDDHPSWSKNKYARLVSNFPLDSIKFVPKKYKSDLFLPNVFRRYIGIPDEMISDHWTQQDTT